MLKYVIYIYRKLLFTNILLNIFNIFSIIFEIRFKIFYSHHILHNNIKYVIIIIIIIKLL